MSDAHLDYVLKLGAQAQAITEKVRRYSEKFAEGQVWRNYGPYAWLKIVMIDEPGSPLYSGGPPCAVVEILSPQTEPPEAGKYWLVQGSDWRRHVAENRFPVGTEAEQPRNESDQEMWMPAVMSW